MSGWGDKNSGGVQELQPVIYMKDAVSKLFPNISGRNCFLPAKNDNGVQVGT